MKRRLLWNRIDSQLMSQTLWCWYPIVPLFWHSLHACIQCRRHQNYLCFPTSCRTQHRDRHCEESSRYSLATVCAELVKNNGTYSLSIFLHSSLYFPLGEEDWLLCWVIRGTKLSTNTGHRTLSRGWVLMIQSCRDFPVSVVYPVSPSTPKLDNS